MSKLKYVNSLIVNNEIWSIALRLKYEYDFFDYFILTEAKTTFSGTSKPVYIEKYSDLIPDPECKIIRVILDVLPFEPETEYITSKGDKIKGNRWPAEHAMRNAATAALLDLDLSDDDIVVVQDVDEIANLSSIQKWGSRLEANQVHRLSYYDFRSSVAPTCRKKEIWNGGFMIRAGLCTEDLHDLRRLHIGKDGNLQNWHIQSPMFISKLDGTPMYNLVQRPDLKLTLGSQKADSPGWHLSGMSGGFDKLAVHKRNSFAHAECDKSPRIESNDYWAEAVEFTDEMLQIGAYDFENLDPVLPSFIRENIRGFPILLDINRS